MSAGLDTNPGLEALLATLLFEGYALYPYTPSAAKNSTPTPFGIVYPPAYAEGNPAAFDRVRLHGIAEGGCETQLSAEVRFLQAAPQRGHRAVERRLAVDARSLAELERAPHEEKRDFGRLRLSATRLGPELWRIAFCIHNTIAVAAGLDRAEALRSSLLSTHPILGLTGGTFISPLERDGAAGAAVAGCESVNTFPVLASPGDDVLLGATIMLPDHPELAPESGGDFFDGTEIEEALVLHVLALSDDERSEIAKADPAIRAMVTRAAEATPTDLIRLHGRTVISQPKEAQ